MDVKSNFKKAVARIYKYGELDNIINNPNPANGKVRNYLEVKSAKRLKEALDFGDANGWNIENIPLIPLINSIDSAEVWKSILICMIDEDFKGVEK